MYYRNNFTDRAFRVMQLANQESQRFNHEYIGTEHVLLGLIKEGGGIAAHVLRVIGVDLRKVRLQVEQIVQVAPGAVPMSRPQSPRCDKAIQYAMEESRNLNHNYIGTEHLLLGLIREREGVAAQVLGNLGLTLEEVREEVLSSVGASERCASERFVSENRKPSSEEVQASLAIAVLREKVRRLRGVDRDIVLSLLPKAIGDNVDEADLAIATICETIYWSEKP